MFQNKHLKMGNFLPLNECLVDFLEDSSENHILTGKYALEHNFVVNLNNFLMGNSPSVEKTPNTLWFTMTGLLINLQLKSRLAEVFINFQPGHLTCLVIHRKLEKDSNSKLKVNILCFALEALYNYARFDASKISIDFEEGNWESDGHNELFSHFERHKSSLHLIQCGSSTDK